MHSAQMELAGQFGAHRALLGAGSPQQATDRCEAACFATAGVMIAVGCLVMLLVSIFCKYWLWEKVYNAWPAFQRFEARIIASDDRVSRLIKLLFVPPDRLPSPPPLLRLSTTQREAREIVNFLKIEDEECPGEESCAVCLDDLDKDCVRLTCKHVFHAKCMRKWVLSKDTCPLCNAPVRAGVLAELQHKYRLPVICVPVLAPAPIPASPPDHVALQTVQDTVAESPALAPAAGPHIPTTPVVPAGNTSPVVPIPSSDPSPLATPQPLAPSPATLSSDSMEGALPAESLQQVKEVEAEFPLLLRRLQLVQQHAFTVAVAQVHQQVQQVQGGAVPVSQPLPPVQEAGAGHETQEQQGGVEQSAERRMREDTPDSDTSELPGSVNGGEDEPLDESLYISQEPASPSVPLQQNAQATSRDINNSRVEVSRFTTLSIVPPNHGSTCPTVVEAAFVCSPPGSHRNSREPSPTSTCSTEAPSEGAMTGAGVVERAAVRISEELAVHGTDSEEPGVEAC